MAAKKNEVTVAKGGMIADGKGGFFSKGDTFEPGEGCDVDALKERDLIK